MNRAKNTPNHLHKLLLAGNKRIYKKGQVLNHDGKTSLSLVKSGYVMRYSITNVGTLSIQSIYGPGHFFPLTAVFHLLYEMEIYSGPETYYYETMCESEIYSVENSVFMETIAGDQQLYKDLLEESGRRFNSNIQRLENISLNNATKRLAHQLSYYGDVFSVPKKAYLSVSVPLTHTNLAAVLNLARETVSNSVSELRQMGLIITTNHTYEIPDLSKLREYAYS